MDIYNSRYKNIGAVIVENDLLKAVFLPENGGKMASFCDKVTGREFLVQANDADYKKLDFDGVYVDAECSGFDDMFPTIDAWAYDRFPWQGTMMADHGEVCGLKWDYETGQDGLHMWVCGVRFPYRLDKWIRFDADNALLISYCASNLCGFDMDYIWAAHVMINAEKDGRINVPYQNGTGVTTVFAGDDGFGRAGHKMTWPCAKRQDGQMTALSITPPQDISGNTFKFYFDEPLSSGVCGYEYKSDNTHISLEVPADRIPYLGVWVNEGAFQGYYNIALEPCTGTFDHPGNARAHNQYSVLPANSTVSWYLRLSVTHG